MKGRMGRGERDQKRCLLALKDKARLSWILVLSCLEQGSTNGWICSKIPTMPGTGSDWDWDYCNLLVLLPGGAERTALTDEKAKKGEE